MKKSYKLLIFTLIVTVVLAFGGATALAADYEHCAEALQAMGLMQGSEGGFELDRAATRAEAAVMLVRLLGVEQEAIDNAYSHPFTDVPEWASPYVGYMYEKGLTKGVSADSFNPQGSCDLRMYSTFVLRVLGYTEAAGDYTYANAESFAMNLGVVDIFTGAGDFTRDNMAAISYTALFAPAKGADEILLAQLMEQGAVQEEAAKTFVDLYNNYALLQAANATLSGLGEEPLEMTLNMTMNMDMGKEGKANVALDSLIQMDAGTISDLQDMEAVLAGLGKIKFVMTNKLDMIIPGSDEGFEDVEFDFYLLDGVAYVDHNLGELLEDETVPAHLKLDINALISLAGASGMDLSAMMSAGSTQDMENLVALMPNDPYSNYYGISMITGIESKTQDDGSVQVDVTYLDMRNDMITSIVGLVYGNMPEMMSVMEQMEMDLNINECNYTLDKDGNIKAQSFSAKINQTMFAGTAEATTMQTDMQMSYEITKTGNDVKFLAPAKDVEYVDLMEMLMGGIAEEEAL